MDGFEDGFLLSCSIAARNMGYKNVVAADGRWCGYTPAMRLAGVSVENYRSFVDSAHIELRPLTLLFGYNSAGKSAIMRLLPILAASTASDQLAPLALDSEAARGASFRDLLSRQSPSPTMKLGLAWARVKQPNLHLDVEIRDLPDLQAQIIERVAVRERNAGLSTVEALWDTQLLEPHEQTRRYEFRAGNTPLGAFAIPVAGLVFEAPQGESFTPVFEHTASALRRLGESVQWLNSSRAVPSRSARFGVLPRRLAADGSNVADFLAHDVLAGGELLRETSAWFERATRHRLLLRRYAVAGEEQYSLAMTPLGATPPFEIPLVDTGEGMSQVLPVIVLGCLAALGRFGREPLVGIEHPELHLHPAAHAELAEFFCRLTSARTRPTIVIETHSENFLLRVQLSIARGQMSAEDVVVHWIRTLEDGRSVVDTITFDAAARPQGSGWPPGVFAEDTEQARSLLLVRKERGLA